MTANPNLFLISLGFFLIATLYSSVGFGGGSSYLALLALILPDFLQIKTSALLCNLVVVSTGSYLFWKKGLFDRKKFLPLAFCSVPAAFLGATVHLTQKSFFIFLGSVLVVSGILLIAQLVIKTGEKRVTSSNSALINIVFGTGTGFLSGLVGIGGGILLSPILNLLRWDTAKRIAALASFFILVNSIAGLAGLIVSNNFKLPYQFLIMLLAAVFVGGQVGTRVSLRILKPEVVKGLTGVLVLYIGLKLVLKYLFTINI